MELVKTNPKKARKMDVGENQLKKVSNQLARAKMKSTFFIAIFMIMFMSLLGESFQGVVVAKLPFTPFSMMRGMTHRNIVGSDYTDCAMIFLYVMSNVCFRPLIQKILGFDGPRGLTANNSMFAAVK